MKREVLPACPRPCIIVGIAAFAFAVAIGCGAWMVRDILHSRELTAEYEAEAARFCPVGSYPYWVSDGSRCVFAGIEPLHMLSLTSLRNGDITSVSSWSPITGSGTAADPYDVKRCLPGESLVAVSATGAWRCAIPKTINGTANYLVGDGAWGASGFTVRPRSQPGAGLTLDSTDLQLCPDGWTTRLLADARWECVKP